ncbi:MAG: urease accessory protein UreF [Actinomycetaceae bacterium]|nr:urease accessory protein UreF [Actinomycetaceae bacterium]
MQSTLTNRHAQLVTWHLTDSALPTGGFAHSAGLETFVQNGEISDPQTYSQWLHGYLRQASFNDALAVKFAVELQLSELGDAQKLIKLRRLDQLLHACQTPRQVRTSMNSMGKRMAKIASFIAPNDYLVAQYAAGIASQEMRANPGIAAGLALGASGVEPSDAVAAYLMQMANSMTQNAIRAIPLGQDAGQKVLVGAYSVIEQATEMTMQHDLSDLGSVAPQLEIAQMAHEELRSRMFMS